MQYQATAQNHLQLTINSSLLLLPQSRKRRSKGRKELSKKA
jgi:hypothetical protein